MTPTARAIINPAIIAALALAACSEIPVSSADCFFYGDTSAGCVIAKAQDEIDKKTAEVQTTEEIIVKAVLAVGLAAVGQRYGSTAWNGR